VKKLIPAIALLLAACTAIFPTPNEFPPPPPMTLIVEPTFPLPTATLEPRLRPITSDDMLEARNFFLIIKTQLIAGDDFGFAEKVHYPIQMTLDGKKTRFSEPDELAKILRAALSPKVMDAIAQTSEDDLILLPDGIRVGHGELWFNLFCSDAACTNTQFLITQINN
jgi:hypothetical protein